LYSAKQEALVQNAVSAAVKDPSKGESSWALPVIASFAMFAMVAGVYQRFGRTLASSRQFGRRFTRQVAAVEPGSDDDLLLRAEAVE